MNLRTFIERPVLSAVISITIVVVGIIGLFTLPVEQYPDIAPPTIMVSTSYFGASAETLQKSVIAPLEEAINGVEDMTYMTSSATNAGTVSITVYFKQGTDPDMAAVNVQNRVSKATGQLPSEVNQVGVTTSKRQTSILQMFSLHSPDDSYDEAFLANYISINLKPEILRISGVGDMMIMGGDYSLRIWMKPDVMAQYRLIPSDVSTVLAEQNIESATGSFGENSDETYQYTMKYKGRRITPEEFGEIVIRSTDEGQACFAYYAWNNGGGFVDADNNWALNSAENAEAVNYVVDLIKSGLTNTDPTNETRYDLQEMFAAGKLAMMIGPNQISKYCEENGGVNYGVASAFVGGHVNAPGVDVGVGSLDGLTGGLQLIPSGGNFHIGSLQDVLVVVQSAGGSQIGHSPNGAVNHGLLQEGGIELCVGLLGNPVRGGQQQTVSLVIGKHVDVQQVGSLTVGNAGVDHGVDVVPGHAVHNDLNVLVLGVELGGEVSPPLGGLLAVLSGQHGDGDLLAGGGGSLGLGAAGGQRQNHHREMSFFILFSPPNVVVNPQTRCTTGLLYTNRL